MSVDSRVALCGREEEEERKRLGARETTSRWCHVLHDQKHLPAF